MRAAHHSLPQQHVHHLLVTPSPVATLTVDHGGGRAAITRYGLHNNGSKQVCLPESTQLLRHQKAQQTQLGNGIEGLAREHILLVTVDLKEE